MNIPISLTVSMLACLLGGIIRKYYTERYGGAGSARHVFNAVTSVAAAAVLFLWGGISSASPFTLILGAAFGVVTAVQTITTLAAMERGPWAYTTVITSLSMLIPTLSGALIWHESIGPLKIVGIVFMVACLVLSVDGGKDAEKRRASFTWLLFCAVAFLFQGGIGVMQKWHQSSAFKEELNAFLVVAFAVSFLYSTVSALILRRKEEHPARDTEMPLWKRALPWVMMVAGGVCVALNNKLKPLSVGRDGQRGILPSRQRRRLDLDHPLRFLPLPRETLAQAMDRACLGHCGGLDALHGIKGRI